MRHLVTELFTNDYDDYLATGQPLKTDDDLEGLRGAVSVSWKCA